MSLATQLRKAAYAFPVVFAIAANANAAQTLELSAIDLSKPLDNVCVADSQDGRAADKLDRILEARGQSKVVEANQVVVAVKNGSPYRGVIFTSNLTPLNPEKKSVYGEGYLVISNKPKGQDGTQYCLSENNATILANAINPKGVPKTFSVGEMGQALSNSSTNANSNMAFGALTSRGTLLTVDFNYNTGKGGMIFADGSGNNAAGFPLVDAGYSSELPAPYQRALGITRNVKVSALSSRESFPAQRP